MKPLRTLCLLLTIFVSGSLSHALEAQTLLIDSWPETVPGAPAPGRKVAETLPAYRGTEVHHLLYLPENYDPSRRDPVLVELTGNRWAYGNGTVEEAHLGYSITLGRDFIWVVPPYVNRAGTANETTWWGDAERTAAYLKELAAHLVENWQADPRRIFLCGFSRGAIGCSYIGLHDDEIARLWCGFLSHDHFDGQREWPGQEWGFPLAEYRQEAAERLKRVGGRDWYVSSNGRARSPYPEVLGTMGVAGFGNYFFATVDIRKRFPTIPNDWFGSAHNDCWPAFDLPESARIRYWLRRVDNRLQGVKVWKRDYVDAEAVSGFGMVVDSGTPGQQACIYADLPTDSCRVVELVYRVDDGTPVRLSSATNPREFRFGLPAGSRRLTFRFEWNGRRSPEYTLSRE